MENWLFIAILILLPSIWLWLHYFKSRKHTVLRSHQTYHGVTIHPCSTACDKVKSLDRIRFLAREVTSLPVLGCTTKECTCTYVHHKDRRNGEDRRIAGITMQGVFIENEHRI